MKRQPRILAGTALGLLMASAPLGAFPLQNSDIVGLSQQAAQAPVIKVQATCDDGTENCAQTGQGEPEQKPRRQKRKEQQPAPAEQAAPAQAEQAAPAVEPEQKPRKHKREAQQAEPAPAEQAAPAQAEQAAPAAEPEQKPRKHKREAQQAEPAPAEQAAPAQSEQAAPAAEPEQKPRRKKEQKAEPTQAEQAPAQAEKPAEQAAEPKSKKEKLREFMKKKQGGEETAEPKQAEQPKPAEKAKPAEQAAPAEGTAPKPEAKPTQAEQAPAQGEKPAGQAGEPKTKKEKLHEFLKKKQGGGEETAQPEQAEQPKSAEEGKPAEQAAPGTQETAPEQKTGEQAPAKNAEGGQQQATQPELPADTKPQAMPKSKNEAEAKPLPKDAAPLPDSAKKGGGQAEGQTQQAEQPAEQPSGQAEQAQQPKGEAEAIPQSDSAAQTALQKIGKIESVDAVEGKRIDAEQWREDRRKRREERRQRDKIDVVKEFGDRTVVKYGDNIYVDNRDANVRLERGSRDSYVEELPDDFSRYTIVKEDGTRVVTIRNADGDIVRRSRIMPDDREVVLYYVPETDYDRIEGGYADAGADLPPLRLTIPADEYILDAETAEPEDYYTYLDAPPVEPVERIYSVDEVVHSARIRDKVRRVDLDTITFDTGSAEIGEAQAAKLEALGDAISKILKQNPAETFLIEGHTDAVGSDDSNLVLSDKRAESVAEALTSVFEIPAENLTTQGYGEKYLKVNTQGENRSNRRVAVRRITPLVSPVASNK